jgi:hypothetical protein
MRLDGGAPHPSGPSTNCPPFDPMWSTSAPPTVSIPNTKAALPPACTSSVKNHSPSPLRPHNTSALSPPPRNRIAAVPFVYRLHPPRPRNPRPSRGRRVRPLATASRQLPPRLAGLPHRATSWRVNSAIGGPSRAFADIGSHWCDLMEYVTGEHIASLVAATTITFPNAQHSPPPPSAPEPRRDRSRRSTPRTRR